MVATPPLSTLYNVLGSKSALHLVGGSVRDAFLQRQGFDLDVATILPPEEIARLLSNAEIRVIPTGIEHGTVTAVIDTTNIEITTFRKPGPRSGSGYSKTIEEDLSGRDFTINAMAFSFAEKKLIDPFCGQRDLFEKRLVAVGDPVERFREDPLRILRMIRFGPSDGRNVDNATVSAAKEIAPLLSTVSVERVRSELEKILTNPHPEEGIEMIRALNLLPIILPEMIPSIGFEQNEFHTEDVYHHTLTVLAQSVPDKIVRLACLFHDLGKPASFSVGEDGRRHFYQHEEISERLCDQAMTRLKFSHDDIDAVRTLVRHHMRPLECGPAGIRRILRDLGPLFEKWREVKIADAPPVIANQEFAAALDKFDTMVATERARPVGSPYDKLAIDGEDLKQLGMKEGRALGQVLKHLLELVIEEPELNTREQLLEKARLQISRES